MRFNPFVPHGPEPFTPIPRSGGPVPSVIEFFKRKIDELFKRDSASVHYTPEEKTDEEKAIARDNIGAQEKLVSGVNLKTVRGQSLLGSGDVPQAPAEWGGITGNLGMQTDLAEALSGKADGPETYTKTETDSAIVANVEDSVTSTSTTKALSANMGKELQDQIQNLKQRGRYLSIWDCTTGLAKTEPIVNPYAYKAGDYFIVGTVAEEGGTNYRPSGTSYDKDVPSTTVETGDPIVNDTYYYDGTSWTLLHTEQSEISWDSVVSKPDTFPPEEHTHTKSEITDFPTSMPPTAHSHASDSWFTTALEDMKRWVKELLPEWLTPSHEEPPTHDFVFSIENKANNARDAAQLAENKAEDALVHADEALAGLDGKANASDFSTSTPASYVTDFVQQSATLQAQIKSVAQSLIRTAVANFDPDEQSFADLVNILKNIGA